MTLPISPLGPAAIAPAIQPATAAAQPGKFQQILEGAIQAVTRPQADAKQAVEGFLSGESEEVHSVALAVQRADLAFELGLQVRNKVISAYQEIMRMQL